MTPLLSSFLQTIRRLLASRAENQRLKVIRETLRDYASKRGISQNNNSKGSL